MTTAVSQRQAVLIFLAFAAAYFFSALVRAITATLAPTLTAELQLTSGDLGLLSGAFFLGFSVLQLPMGNWLDRVGPRRVEVPFLIAAVLGCLAFAVAESFYGLLAARLLCGAGFAACLMAPLTGYRRWYAPTMQLRANAWMLMTGSLGMLAATLPVQWLLPWMGWRWLFVVLAGLILIAIAMLMWNVPTWHSASTTQTPLADGGYAEVGRHPYFRALAPLGFFTYGGMVAVQTLWAGPWLTAVVGVEPVEAASGLFMINLTMLFTFWGWGVLNPRFIKRGWDTNRLMAWGIPASFLALLGNLLLGANGGWWSLALFCMASSFVTLSQPALGLAFASHLAGRALSAYNLVLFCGVFVVQWGVGVLVDVFKRGGAGDVLAFQWAFTVLLLCQLASYIWFLRMTTDNPAP
jgi:MFS family permease